MEMMRYPGVLPVDAAGQTGGTSAPVVVGTGPRLPEQPTVRSLTGCVLGQTGSHGLVRGAGQGATVLGAPAATVLGPGPSTHPVPSVLAAQAGTSRERGRVRT